MLVKADNVVTEMPPAIRNVVGNCRATWGITDLNLLKWTIWCNSSKVTPEKHANSSNWILFPLLSNCQSVLMCGLVQTMTVWPEFQGQQENDLVALFLAVCWKQAMETKGTYKQDFCVSKWLLGNMATICEETFNCLLVTFAILSPLALIKYSVSVSSTTPRMPSSSDQLPTLNIPRLPPDG